MGENANSNTNNNVYGGTESSYESPSKDLDLSREPWRHHFNTTAAGKASSFIERSCASDLLLGHLTKNQNEMQFMMA